MYEQTDPPHATLHWTAGRGPQNRSWLHKKHPRIMAMDRSAAAGALVPITSSSELPMLWSRSQLLQTSALIAVQVSAGLHG